jgi:hypothetical protein
MALHYTAPCRGLTFKVAGAWILSTEYGVVLRTEFRVLKSFFEPTLPRGFLFPFAAVARDFVDDSFLLFVSSHQILITVLLQ